jgi:hypothetical protein
VIYVLVNKMAIPVFCQFERETRCGVIQPPAYDFAGDAGVNKN